MAGTNGYNPGAAVSLRDLRQQRGLSLRQLEDETGISRAVWSQVERGKLLAEPHQVAALSAVFEIPPAAWRVRFLLEALVPA